MKLMRIISMMALLAVLPLSAQAQMTDQSEVRQINRKYDVGVTKRPSLPLIDLSRLHMTQSYTMSFVSGSFGSGMQGLYQNTLSYQLANPLRLTLNMGILHDPSALVGNSQFSNSMRFLPSGWLDWRPSENFRMVVGFETIPAGYYNGYYGSGRYDYWRW